MKDENNFNLKEKRRELEVFFRENTEEMTRGQIIRTIFNNINEQDREFIRRYVKDLYEDGALGLFFVDKAVEKLDKLSGGLGR